MHIAVIFELYSGLNLNQDKATKPQIVRQGKATPYWFKVNPLYFLYFQRFQTAVKAV